MNKFSLLWKDFPKPQYMYTVLKSHVAFTSTYFSLHVYSKYISYRHVTWLPLCSIHTCNDLIYNGRFRWDGRDERRRSKVSNSVRMHHHQFSIFCFQMYSGDQTLPSPLPRPEQDILVPLVWPWRLYLYYIHTTLTLNYISPVRKSIETFQTTVLNNVR